MRTSVSLLVGALCLVQSAACDESRAVDPDELLGTYQLKHQRVVAGDGETWESEEGSHWLGIGDSIYFRTYVNGVYELSDRRLVLFRGGIQPAPAEPAVRWRDYDILWLDGERLVVRTSGTPEDLWLQAPDFDRDEVVEITETYLRQD